MENLLLPEKINCGYFDCSEFGTLKTSPERICTGFEIEYYIEDGLFTYLDGKEIPVKKDHILIARAGQKRNSLLPFKTLFLKFECGGLIAKRLASLPEYFFSLHGDSIKEKLKKLILLSEQDTDKIYYGGLFLMILSEIADDAEHVKRGTNFSYPVMEEAKIYIEQNYRGHISSADMAKHVSMSESRFRFVFKKAFGITAHEYLVTVRINAAKQMLWSTRYGMTEIAESCGFGCQQYFTDCFNRAVGMPPMKYRHMCAEKYNGII